MQAQKAKRIATPDEAAPQTETLGRRERNKLQRRQKIKAASRAVFFERGYSGATTREIAKRAGVAEGTIFLYWKDKRDLLLGIINDDLDEVARLGLSKASQAKDFLRQLIEVFQPRYLYWAHQPKLFSAAVYAAMLARAMDEQSEETIRYDDRQRNLLSGLTGLVRSQQRAGNLTSSHQAGEIARLFMAIYLSEFRMWIVEEGLDVSKGIAQLRKSFRIAIDGSSR